MPRQGMPLQGEEWSRLLDIARQHIKVADASYLLSVMQ